MAKEDEPVHPDIIFVDKTKQTHEEGEGQREETFSQEQYYQSFQKLEEMRYPTALRVLTFFAAAGLVLAAGLLAVLSAFFFVLSAVTLFQVERLNQLAKIAWSGLQKVAAFFLGFFVATFSPALGFGIIILYFMLRGEGASDAILNRVMGMRF